MKNLFHVYRVVNRQNGKVYIGWTGPEINADRRFSVHLANARAGCAEYFYRAIRKYGEENFTLDIIVSTDSEESVKHLEIEHIRLHASNNPEFGYNSTIGGDGVSSYSWTDEMRLRHSETLKRYYADNPEAREKIRARAADNICTSGRLWLDPEARQCHSERTKAALARPEIKYKQRANIHAALNSPEIRARHLAGIAKTVSSESWRNSVTEANRRIASNPLNTIPRRIGWYVKIERATVTPEARIRPRENFVEGVFEEAYIEYSLEILLDLLELVEAIFFEYDKTGLVRKPGRKKR